MEGKEVISQKQAIATAFLMFLSRVVALGYNNIAGPDSYIANILAFVLAIPLFFMLSRIIKIFPGKDFFEILDSLLGKILGKVLAVFCIAYAVILGATTLRGYAYYVYIQALPETPLYFLYLVILCFVAAGMYAGVETRARMGHFMAWVFAVFVTVALLLSLNVVKMEQIKPIMYNGFGPVWNGALSMLVFPYGSAVLLLVPFAHLKSGSRPFGILFKGALYACIVISLTFLRNLLVLGPEALDFFLYPSHQAVSLISIGNFLERLEILPAILTLLCDVTRISISIYFAAVGMQRLFNLPDYKLFIVPVVFLMFNYSLLSKDYISDVVQWRQVFPYFALPFKIVLPVVLYIIAEIRHRVSRMLQNMAQTAS